MDFRWINESTITETNGRIEIFATEKVTFSVITEQIQMKESHRRHCVMHLLLYASIRGFCYASKSVS